MGRADAAADPSKAMMDQQGQMMGTMKGTLVMFGLMALQMGWVNYFFNGFVLAKVPFPLTQKFRVMTQNSVDVENLDVRYVSALSFYFVVMFGMSQLMTLLMDSESTDDEEGSKADPMGMGAGGMGGMGGMGPMGMGGMGGAGGMGGLGAMFGGQQASPTKVYET